MCVCQNEFTSRVKDTNSWAKLPIGLKAIMNPFITCKCVKRDEMKPFIMAGNQNLLICLSGGFPVLPTTHNK